MVQTKEEKAVYGRKYREENKEKIVARDAKYQQENKEKIAAQKYKYHQENKEKIAAQKAEYRQKNKEKIAARKKEQVMSVPLAVWARSVFKFLPGIVRGPCEVCGDEDDVDAHHDDYVRAMDVRWLCQTHHKRHHAKYGEAKNARLPRPTFKLFRSGLLPEEFEENAKTLLARGGLMGQQEFWGVASVLLRSTSRLARLLGVSSSSIRYWCCGESPDKIENRLKILAYARTMLDEGEFEMAIFGRSPLSFETDYPLMVQYFEEEEAREAAQ